MGVLVIGKWFLLSILVGFVFMVSDVIGGRSLVMVEENKQHEGVDLGEMMMKDEADLFVNGRGGEVDTRGWKGLSGRSSFAGEVVREKPVCIGTSDGSNGVKHNLDEQVVKGDHGSSDNRGIGGGSVAGGIGGGGSIGAGGVGGLPIGGGGNVGAGGGIGMGQGGGAGFGVGGRMGAGVGGVGTSGSVVGTGGGGIGTGFGGVGSGTGASGAGAGGAEAGGAEAGGAGAGSSGSTGTGGSSCGPSGNSNSCGNAGAGGN